MNQQLLPSHNPAERLLVILTELAQSPGHKAILAVFSEVLNINADSDSTSFFCKGVTPILVLIDCIKKEIKDFPEIKRNSYQSALDDIRKGFSQVVSLAYFPSKDKWGYASPLNDPDWPILKQSLPPLVHDFEEYGISLEKKSLDDLKNEVESLIQEVQESELEQDFKLFLITKLRDIRDVIEKYHYYGRSGLKKEIESTLFQIGIKSQQYEQTEKNKEIIKKVVQFGIAALTILDLTVNTPSNIDKISSWFGGINLLPPHESTATLEETPKLPPSTKAQQ